LLIDGAFKEATVSMRAWIGMGTMIALAACGVAAPMGAEDAAIQPQQQPAPGDERAASEQEALSRPGDASSQAGPPEGGSGISPRVAVPCLVPCPDGKTCTCGPNGTGVYAVEGGSAGIDVIQPDGVTREIMITHFINDPFTFPQIVTFRYGYFDAESNQWIPLPGTGVIATADYQSKQDLRVLSVDEASTVPTWTLYDTTTKTTITVSNHDLIYLKLHVAFIVDTKTWNATLDFTDPQVIPGNHTTVNAYNMRWQTGTPATPVTYCHKADGSPDLVVFQKGIDVDPATGSVTRQNAAQYITVSCYLGAPAQVYSWGYIYLDPADLLSPRTFYFDAGIHMKRASYCGDEHYYTVAGTLIRKSDNLFINNEVKLPMEASWGTKGARCVNSERMRHREMAPVNSNLFQCNGQPYQPGQQPLQDCTFWCNGTPLPRCSPPPPQPPLQLPPPPPPSLTDAPI
jgi:hypothetical protein